MVVGMVGEGEEGIMAVGTEVETEAEEEGIMAVGTEEEAEAEEGIMAEGQEDREC
jgi:hypothetical protein